MVGMLAALVPSIVLVARHGVAGAEDGHPVRAVPGARRVVALFVGHPLLDAYLSL